MKRKFSNQSSAKTGSQGLVLYGRHAVMSALNNPNRKISKLVCTPENALEIREKFPNLNIITADRKDIDKLVPSEAVHQGYALFCTPLDNLSVEELCEMTANDKKCNVLILDQVTDPQNIGAIIRSCVCAGVKGIILPSRRGVLINPTVEKTSAGAINHISIIKVNSIVNAVQRLKEKNYWVIAADHHSKDNYYDIDYTDMNFAVIMGAEHAGVSKSLLKLSDFVVKIPMLTNFNSLNVSNALSAIIFERISSL